MLEPSDDAFNLIKKYEGLRLRAYKCPAGKYTIGYGHTANVKYGDIITVEKAEELLKKDVSFISRELNQVIKIELNQHQFDALVSFTFNVGIGAFTTSTLLKKINSNNLKEVPTQLLRWVYVGKKITKGLVNRRKAEAELFIKPQGDL